MADYQKIHNGSRIDADTFKDILNHIRLRVTEDYEFPPEIVRIEGTTIATLGNFSASTGKPKSKFTLYWEKMGDKRYWFDEEAVIT